MALRIFIFIVLTVVLQGTSAAPFHPSPVAVSIPHVTTTHDVSPTNRDATVPSSGVVVINAGVTPSFVVNLGHASLEAIIAAEAAAFEAVVDTHAAHLKPCVESTADILDILVGSSRPKKVNCVLPATDPQVPKP